MKKNTEPVNCAKRAVAFLLARIYGIRGALKPPLGGPRAGWSYPLRYRAWKVVSAIYDWSGLPDEWERRVSQ